MAAVETPYSSAMIVEYQVGMSGMGAPITRQKTFNYLKFDASEQAVFNTAHNLFALTQHPVVDVLRRKTFQIADQP